MRRIRFIVLFLTLYLSAKADHITGGEMYYTFLGAANGQYRYAVTFKLFMRCNSGRQFNNPSIISVFNKSTNARVSDFSVALSRTETLQLTNASPCVANPPLVCYEVGYYEFQVTLPESPEGYIITGQVVFRVAGISNLVANYGSIGATYTAEIPSTSSLSNAPQNSSARFTGSDLVVICAGNFFSYSFAATDDNGDQLRYSFGTAYQGGSGGGGNMSSPPMPPPYESVPYSSTYSGSSPLGSRVRIDANTGLITGIAPDEAGIYVVTVSVDEVRNGVVIATQRKDIQINIAPCTVASARLKPAYMLCRDTKTLTISNLSLSPLISSQFWQFLNYRGESLFTSSDPVVSFSFPDTGTYTIKLVINRGQQCSDSTTSIARVFPGFIPEFGSRGICFKKPSMFFDSTTTVYGSVVSWNWDFGEGISDSSVTTLRNPTFTYSSTGTKNVRLIAGNSVGCVDTVLKSIVISDKPPIGLAFRDTLICLNDKVQLQASGSGSFSWTPSINIINATTAGPVVSPPSTATYFVDLDEDGCLNRDSVKVRVTDHVNLLAMSDTTICQGDSIQLRVTSDGFKFLWSPSPQLTDASLKNPTAITNATTIYHVQAAIGGCTAQGQVMVTTVPYPLADAGPDTTICYKTMALLHAHMDGASFTWSTDVPLSDRHLLNPTIAPSQTTNYILYVSDVKGCPKNGIDTVKVSVLPPIHPFAGRDTSVVAGQPLQLQATGGIRYLWSPVTGLSSANTSSPVLLFNEPVNGTRYKVLVYNEAACVDSSFITVTIFKTLPSIFVPNAFTPNADGRNDRLRPIAVGMQNIDYFMIYNRWGQLVFRSEQTGAGWDGSVNGKLQDSGVFVWMVKATDYKGKPYFNKGTVLLIR